MKKLLMASAMLVVLLGQGAGARADLHANAATNESRGEYAAKLADRTKPGLALMAGANVADVLLACPVDAAEVAVLAVTDTLPIVSTLGGAIAFIKYEFAHNRNAEPKHVWQLQGFKLDQHARETAERDLGYDELTTVLATQRGATAEDPSSVTMYLGAGVPLAVSGGIDAVHDGLQAVMNRHPQYSDWADVRSIARNSYLNTEAEYLLSFKNDQSHCRGSLRKLRQIGHEVAARHDEDHAAVKTVSAASTPQDASSQTPAPGVRATN